MDAKTAANYLDLLVDLLIARRLPAWHANIGKRLVKSICCWPGRTAVCGRWKSSAASAPGSSAAFTLPGKTWCLFASLLCMPDRSAIALRPI